MNLKKRVTLGVSAAFVAIIGIAFLIIYISFSSFRAQDFYTRLENKARATAKLLFDIQEVSDTLLYRIEKDTPYKMWHESIVIVNSNKEVIFMSDEKYSGWYDTSMIQTVKNHGEMRTVDGKLEIIGIHFGKEQVFYVFVAAEDKYGNSKNQFLFNLLLASFVLSTFFIAVVTRSVVKRALLPLDQFKEEITQISTQNLHEQLPESQRNDEVEELTRAFNKMLGRIEIGYRSQASFTSHASHELRTPIARILFQLDNLVEQAAANEDIKLTAKNVARDAIQMSELISSLLTLARVERSEMERNEQIRIDELIFEVYEENQEDLNQLKINFNITGDEDKLELVGSKSLVAIVILNLFRNARNYSANQSCSVELKGLKDGLLLSFGNEGLAGNSVNPDQIFTPFVRGKHQNVIAGSGLGLSIVKRIVEYHNGSVTYTINNAFHSIDIFIPQES